MAPSHVELQSLAKGIEQDKAAVLAGLSLPHNNGVVEGKVNKLKRDLAHDVWQGRMCVTSPAGLTVPLKRGYPTIGGA